MDLWVKPICRLEMDFSTETRILIRVLPDIYVEIIIFFTLVSELYIVKAMYYFFFCVRQILIKYRVVSV